jgi:hypothetical protein
VLFWPSPAYRIAVCAVVSVAEVGLTVRSFFFGTLITGLAFLTVLGGFTPFHSRQYFHSLGTILDLAALALFAVSPMALRKTGALAVSSLPKGMS